MSRTSSLTAITNQLGKLREDDGGWFKSWNFLVPKLEPAVPGHHVVPYTNLPRCPAMESGHSEPAPLVLLLTKHLVKLPKVCIEGKALKISLYKMRECYLFHFVFMIYCQGTGDGFFFFLGITHFSACFLSRESWSKPTNRKNPIWKFNIAI